MPAQFFTGDVAENGDVRVRGSERRVACHHAQVAPVPRVANDRGEGACLPADDFEHAAELGLVDEQPLVLHAGVDNDGLVFPSWLALLLDWFLLLDRITDR